MLLGSASRKGPLQDGVCFFHLPEGEKKTKKRRVIAAFYNLAVCGRLEDIPEASRNRPLKEPVKGLAVRKKTNVPQVFPSLSKRTSDFLSRLAIVCSEGVVGSAWFCSQQIKSGISFHRRALREEKPSADAF